MNSSLPPMITLSNSINNPLSKLLLLGSGELGKEFAIAAHRLGIYIVAVGRYPHAPAMQVAHHSHVIDMTDPAELRRIVELEAPTHIVPEIEAIHIETLLTLEEEGWNVIPNARAVWIAMDRVRLRTLAADKLNLPTSRYELVETLEELHSAARSVGFPCVSKPVMSSSGKGQLVLHSEQDIETAWNKAQTECRGVSGQLIVEEFIDFSYEITLLTVRHQGGISYCEPIGHLQHEGDYHTSWQPQKMTPQAKQEAQRIARTIVDALGGKGIFGVEMFVTILPDGTQKVYFNEVSPRPHDTGYITLQTQNLSEFDLHLRAILDIPIPPIRTVHRGCSYAINIHEPCEQPRFHIPRFHFQEGVFLYLFGKQSVPKKRRLGILICIDTLKQSCVSTMIDFIDILQYSIPDKPDELHRVSEIAKLSIPEQSLDKMGN